MGVAWRAVNVQHLGGRPVDPSFAVGVDVEQNQTLHQVGEDQLRAESTDGFRRIRGFRKISNLNI